MDLDFFIKLTLATHKVANILSEEDEQGAKKIRGLANRILVDFILFGDRANVVRERKNILARQAVQDVDALIAYFNEIRRDGWINPANFSILAQEYEKATRLMRQDNREESIEEIPRDSKESRGSLSPQRVEGAPSQKYSEITERQKKILDLLGVKQKVQVWELQKVMPQVTKRTLRRDLDDLLELNLIERKGEWNEVFYELKR